MSIKVAIEDLPAAIAERGSAAFICTVSDPPVTHLTHVEIALVDGRLECTTGRSSRRNAGERASVVVLWPSRGLDDLSLIVDGDAVVTPDGLAITPTGAVLHRRPDSA